MEIKGVFERLTAGFILGSAEEVNIRFQSLRMCPTFMKKRKKRKNLLMFIAKPLSFVDIIGSDGSCVELPPGDPQRR